MENKIFTKKIEIDGINFNIHKTIPQSPIEMSKFLIKYLKSTNPTIHPDFKHMFDYVDSIIQYNNYYLLSLLYIPPCPLGTNSLGNFFGQKMNNVSKDLTIFPFGNTIISHNSLVSKRTGKHPAYILVSIKGNKLLHNTHPSCSNNKTIGNYIVDKWTNNILNRYENYIFTFGIQICIEEEYLKSLEKIKQTKNNNLEIKTNEIQNQIEIKKEQNNNLEIKTNEIQNQIENQKEQNDNLEIKSNEIQIENQKEQNDNLEIKLNEIQNQPNDILNILNELNNKENLLNNINILNINYINSIENNLIYHKYQNEIINLKRLVFYLIKNNGKLLNDIDKDFTEDFLKNIFGINFKNFLT